MDGIDAKIPAAYHAQAGIFLPSHSTVEYYFMELILQSLPQLGVIEEADAARWILGVLRHHPANAEWHARRLHGFGGSEIGPLVSFYRNEEHSGFQNVTQVVEGKLMKRLPTFENVHTRRGNRLERLAIQAYCERYGAVIDTDATAALSRAKSKAGYEFLVGNTDLIVRRQGKRILVDTKVPSTFSEEVEFDYRAQLHHYSVLCAIAGVRIDGAEIAKLDLASELAEHLVAISHTTLPHRLPELAKSIGLVDMPGFRIVALPVPIERSFQAECIAAAKDCWHDYVLKGEIPRPKAAPMAQMDEAKALQVGRFQQQYLMAKSGIKYLEGMANKASAGIVDALTGIEFAGKSLPFDAVTVQPKGLDGERVIEEALARGVDPQAIKVQAGYSIAQLVAEVQRLNGDVSADHLFTFKDDASLAEQYLKEKGVDLSEFRSDVIAVALGRNKAATQIKEAYQKSAEESFQPWFDRTLIDVSHAEAEPAADEYHQELPAEVETGHLSQAFARDSSLATSQVDDLIPMRAIPGLR